MRLSLITTNEAWAQFEGFFTYRNRAPPPRPSEGIWIVDDKGILVAGVCIYRCEDAPYLLVEHIASRPGVSPRLLYHAIEVGIAHLKVLATMQGRLIIGAIEPPQIAGMLERAGFKPQEAVVMTYWGSGAQCGEYNPKTKVEPEVPNAGGDAQAPELDEPTVPEPAAPSNPRRRR